MTHTALKNPYAATANPSPSVRHCRRRTRRRLRDWAGYTGFVHRVVFGRGGHAGGGFEAVKLGLRRVGS